MSTDEKLLEFGAAWRKYGVYIAILIFVVGFLALLFHHTDQGVAPRDQMEKNMEKP